MINNNKDSFIHHFIKGETISSFWNLLTKGIGLLNTFLSISSLTIYQYGVFQLLISIPGISSDVINTGGSVVSNEISRAISDKRDSDAKSIFIESSVIRLTISIVLWLATYLCSFLLINKYGKDLVSYVQVLSLLFITETFFLILKTLCLVRLDFTTIALRSALNRIIQFTILLFFFLADGLGIRQLIWSVVIASFVSLIIFLPKFLKLYSPWRKINISSKKLLLNIYMTYGKWDIFRQIGNKITFRIKPWLIKFFISTEAVAIFSIAEMIVTNIQDMIPNKTLQSLIPLWVKDVNSSNRIFSYGIKYFALFGTIISIISLILVPPVIHLFFSKYIESLTYFYFMIINVPIFAIGIVIGNYVIALRKQKFIFFQHMVRNIIAIGIISVSIPFIGLWGLVIEFISIPLLMVIISYLYTKKRSPGFSFNFDIILGYNDHDRQLVSKIFFIFIGWFKKLFI